MGFGYAEAAVDRERGTQIRQRRGSIADPGPAAGDTVERASLFEVISDRARTRAPR